MYSVFNEFALMFLYSGIKNPLMRAPPGRPCPVLIEEGT